jgi:predicted NAD/FAD-binding protein
VQPGFLGLLAQVPRFHRLARRHVRHGPDRESLGGFLRRNGFSRYFADHFAVPLVSAVWSCGPRRVLDYPARYLFVFHDNHGALSVSGSPAWRTVEGGSRTYVDLIVKRLHSVRTGDPVRSVRRHADGVTVHDSLGSPTEYDGVVVATHPDQALRLLADSTERERRILGAIRYERNVAVLHTDASVLPRRSGARASWNHVLTACRSRDTGGARVCYDLNGLQRLEASRQYVVSLNDTGAIDPDSVIERMIYEHPLYTAESVAAQRLLPALNDGRTAFAGAYHGWGFHEDGCRSGADAAASLGVRW